MKKKNNNNYFVKKEVYTKGYLINPPTSIGHSNTRVSSINYII